jgi:hypothetical protein
MNALDRDLSYALDPVRLFEDAINGPADPWQRAVLESDARRSLLLACRQSGKSTVTSIKALHTAKYQPGSLTLLLSPSLRQSGELFRKVASAYHAVGGTDDDGVLMESALRLELRNGSRVIALPGSEATTRGYSGCDLLIIDEASRCEDSLIAATRPSQATRPNAQLIELSTPRGKRGHFWKEWSEGGDTWARYEVKAADVSRIDPEFLAQERRSLGEFLYLQEYENLWLDSDTQLIATDLVQAAMCDDGERPFWG